MSSTTPGNHRTAVGDSSSTAERIAQHDIFERFARAGFVMTGIVHLFIAYIAARLAFGGSGGSADQSGAMAELAAKPGGTFALWLGAVAFVLLALWRFAEAALGKASEPEADSKKSEALHRAKAFCLGVIYVSFALSAYGFARGHGKSSSGESIGLTARLMESTLGKIALVIGGLVIIGVGGYHIYKGVSRKFLHDLENSPGAFVRRLGLVGYTAKGAAVAAVGLLVILATVQSNPNRAAGLDGALKTLGAQPFGIALLLIAALGIATYGLYSFVMARHAKM
ncbi:DUF1206 domain-containing protein [Nocardia jejuensis]|uniref:DUF1206 domain-containing protein n=1 Tax=Nocardia jejuensis TaxID=328049 RepID=UPI000B100D3D|nr:DUF1206 domain-containing protein [Nocardia jejuensis]